MMEFPSLHVYNMDTLIDNKDAELLKGKLCWQSIRVQAVWKFMVSIELCTEFCFLNFMSEVPYTMCLLFALFCLSIRLSDHHGLQFAF